MGEAIAFYTLATLVLAFAVLVVSTKDTVHSVLYLVLDFLFVAALYVLLQAEFVAVIQVLVYAGGIVVLYLFVVMLVNLKRPPEAHRIRERGAIGGRRRRVETSGGASESNQLSPTNEGFPDAHTIDDGPVGRAEIVQSVGSLLGGLERRMAARHGGVRQPNEARGARADEET